MRQIGGLDEILKLTVSPSIAVTFSMDPCHIELAVSLQAVFVLEDVINPLLQIVKNEQPVFLSHSLSDFLEARRAENLNNLHIPDPDEVRDSLCQYGGVVLNLDAFSSQKSLPGHWVSRQQNRPIDLHSIGAPLYSFLSICGRADAASGKDGKSVPEFLPYEEAVNRRHCIRRRVVTFFRIVIRGKAQDIERRLK
jgi:hypothetical protein